MERFRVFRSKHYKNKLLKIDKSEKDIIMKFEQSLKEQPFSGKPLGYNFFREKKIHNKRVLFLVYEEHKCIFLITITDKKAQQHEIDLIKENLQLYKKELENLLNKI
jgi:mRNA-degrading endonuclease RelE of RelBE toxin-antitoxin system